MNKAIPQSNPSFIGRAQELGQLITELSDDNPSGNIKFVSGDAGIGKSALLLEIAQRVADLRYQVARSDRIENPAAPPFFTWMLTLRSCLASYKNDKQLAKDMGSNAALLANLLPELKDRLALNQVQPLSNTQTARFELFDAVSQFLIAKSRHQPLVILLDNLHLADGSSLELLEYLAQQIASYPIFIFAAYRHFGVGENDPLDITIKKLTVNPRFSQHRLEGLNQNEVAPLVYTHSGMKLPKPVVDSIYTQSEGNPLFIVEAAKMLHRRYHDGSLTKGELHFEVPNSLQQVIQKRLSGFKNGKQVIKQAAVLGRDFKLQWLKSIIKSDGQSILDTLQQAQNIGILEQTSPGNYRFHHALYPEAIYAQLNSLDRQALHHAAALYFENLSVENQQTWIEQIAHHYYEIALHGYADKAIYYNRLAASQAYSKNAFNEAAIFLERALQVLDYLHDGLGKDDFEIRFDLLLHLGSALYRSGRVYSAPKPLLNASQLALGKKDWLKLAQSLAELQFVYAQMGSMDKSCLPMHQSLIEHIPDDNVGEKALAKASLSDALRLSGEFYSAIEIANESLNLATEIKKTALLFECYRRCVWALFCPTITPERANDEWVTSAEREKLANKYGSIEDKMLVTAADIFYCIGLGEPWDTVQNHMNYLDQLLATRFHPHFYVLLKGFEISSLVYKGDWNTAISLATELRKKSNDLDLAGLEGNYGHQMFVIHRTQGQLPRYASLLLQIEAMSEKNNFWLPGILILHCELKNWQKAKILLAEIGPIKKLPIDYYILLSMIYIGEACLMLDNRQKLAEVYKALQKHKNSSVVLPAVVALGSTSGYLAVFAARLGKKVQARKFFEKALEHNESMRALPWLTRVRVDFAQFLLSSSNPKDQSYAQDLMVLARPDAEQLNLQPVLDKLDSLVKNTDLGQLTKRELGVLRLVAQGFSNKRIADELSVSLSTVATHVRNILRKLRVSNRTEATDFARRSALIE